MVPKASPGDWRPCGDYRMLNNAAVPDRYPLSQNADFYVPLRGATIFSKIELVNAYQPNTRKTAIITSFALFEFVRMPFGFRNTAHFCTIHRHIDKRIASGSRASTICLYLVATQNTTSNICSNSFSSSPNTALSSIG